MSLLNRLWVSVALAMVLALCGTLVVSVVTARNYLAQQLYAQASDSAASLALSMTQQRKDAATSESLVSALFDSGHFETIVFRGLQNEEIVARHTAAPAPEAPAWFVALVPLDAAAGEALVSDGWRQFGRVEVRASARFAYGELWRGAQRMALTLAAIGVVLCLALAALMRWTQGPLRAIVAQADAIGQRRFVMLPEPAVPELRVVGRAMNTMVARVQAMYAEQAARIEQLRNETNRDALTHLASRGLFMGGLRDALQDEQAAPGGAVLVVRVSDLVGLNRRLGRERTDLLIQACATMLGERLGAQHEVLLARLNGAEFGVLLPEAGVESIEGLIPELLEGFERLYRQEYADRSPVAALAWTLYRRGESLADVMLRLDAALMQAESAQPPVAGNAGATPPAAARGEQWRERLEAALVGRRFHLAFFPVLRADGRLLHREAMLRLDDGSGEVLTAGQFMPPALRLGLSARMDLLTLELAVTQLAENAGADIAVNLSPLSLEDEHFLAGVAGVLEIAGSHARRLWVELSERGLGDSQALGDFARLLMAHGVHLGIEHFGRDFGAIPRLHALSVDYLKLDGAFVAEIDQQEANQRFVKTVVDVARSLDIEVIAERVATRGEWDALARLGVAGITGPAATRSLAGEV